MTLSLAEFYSGEFAVYVAYSCHFVFLGVRRNRNLLKLFSSCVAFQLRISSVTLHPVHHLFTAGIHHHHLLSLNCEGRWGTTDDFATIFLHLSLFSTALWDLSNSRPVHGQAWSRNLQVLSVRKFYNRGLLLSNRITVVKSPV